MVSYLYQVYTNYDVKGSAICLGPLFDSRQFYRMFTSEFTHGNPAHILFNMSGLLIFGVDVEKTYGTAFYMTLHFILMLVSTLMSITFYAFMAFLVPMEYRGGPQNFFQCGIGYSNILFGIAMIFSFVGNP